MKELTKKISQWGFDRKITINGKPATQMNKTMEEALELLEAYMLESDELMQDAIGDVYVTLVMQSELQGFSDFNFEKEIASTTSLRAIYEILNKTNACQKQINLGELDESEVHSIVALLQSLSMEEGFNFKECVELAYNEIKDRKGYLNEAGDFIKEVK